MLKAIPTTYKGVKYRSRAEARWAVVFDHVGWKHFYEPEGFSLPSGPYLPDFYLPDIGAYFEVKGREPDSVERALATELCEAADAIVIVSTGPPNHGRKPWDEDLIIMYPEREDDDQVVAFEYRGGFVDRRWPHHPACSIDLGNLAHLGSLTEVDWRTAFIAAATSRFGVH